MKQIIESVFSDILSYTIDFFCIFKFNNYHFCIFILVTRRIKGYTRFVGKYELAESSVSDPIKYIYIDQDH